MSRARTFLSLAATTAVSAALTLSAATGSEAIVGGKTVDWRQAPYLLTVQIKAPERGGFCSATLVTPVKVVTAAHCATVMAPGQARPARDLLPSELTVTGGRTNADTEPGVSAPVAKVWAHPGFNWLTTVNDLAVLTLAKPLWLGTLPIATPRDAADVNRPGVKGSAYGWGSTDPNSTRHDPLLHTAVLPVVDGKTCRTWYGDKYAPETVDPALMLCAGYEQGGIGPCYGDSGGPLVVAGRLAGVYSSGGLKCADLREPGKYVKVTAFHRELAAQLR